MLPHPLAGLGERRGGKEGELGNEGRETEGKGGWGTEREGKEWRGQKEREGKGEREEKGRGPDQVSREIDAPGSDCSESSMSARTANGN